MALEDLPEKKGFHEKERGRAREQNVKKRRCEPKKMADLRYDSTFYSAQIETTEKGCMG